MKSWDILTILWQFLTLSNHQDVFYSIFNFCSFFIPYFISNREQWIQFFLPLLSCFIFANKSHLMAFHCRKRKCLHTTVVSTGNTDFDNTRLNFFCCCCFSRFILMSVICHVLYEMIQIWNFVLICLCQIISIYFIFIQITV